MKSQSLKLKKSDKMASSEKQMKKVNSGLNWKTTDLPFLQRSKITLLISSFDVQIKGKRQKYQIRQPHS
jgi:hypothetical protein